MEAIWDIYSLHGDCRALELRISDFVSYGTYLIISAGAETNLVFINDIFFLLMSSWEGWRAINNLLYTHKVIIKAEMAA